LFSWRGRRDGRRRWDAPVVEGFVGALQGARASKGIIFTASDFFGEARAYADSVSSRTILVDGLPLDSEGMIAARKVTLLYA
jgi:restriction endonuclease Mrr